MAGSAGTEGSLAAINRGIGEANRKRIDLDHVCNGIRVFHGLGENQLTQLGRPWLEQHSCDHADTDDEEDDEPDLLTDLGKDNA